MITHESSSYQIFHSFDKEIQSEFLFSVTTKNLLLSLAESIAQSLHVMFVEEQIWETTGHGRQKS
jgi:hypothetical protein